MSKINNWFDSIYKKASFTNSKLFRRLTEDEMKTIKKILLERGSDRIFNEEDIYRLLFGAEGRRGIFDVLGYPKGILNKNHQDVKEIAETVIKNNENRSINKNNIT